MGVACAAAWAGPPDGPRGAMLLQLATASTMPAATLARADSRRAGAWNGMVLDLLRWATLVSSALRIRRRRRRCCLGAGGVCDDEPGGDQQCEQFRQTHVDQVRV